MVLPCKKEGMSECEEVSQCNSEPSSEHVNRWSGLVGWKWTSHTAWTKRKAFMKQSLWKDTYKMILKFKWHIVLSAECASMSEKGVLPCLTSQTHSMPSCPPVATMCCWLGCLSTQCRGTRSPDLKIDPRLELLWVNITQEIYQVMVGGLTEKESGMASCSVV